MTDYDVKAIANAAWEVLYCTGRDFLLAIPHEGNLLIYRSNCKNKIADSVFCRLDKFYRNQLEVSFDDKPQPELPENTGILSGTITSYFSGANYFEIKFSNGKKRLILVSEEVAEYLSKNAKVGDKIKSRAHLDSEYMIISPDDILSHTRVESVTVNLKE